MVRPQKQGSKGIIILSQRPAAKTEHLTEWAFCIEVGISAKLDWSLCMIYMYSIHARKFSCGERPADRMLLDQLAFVVGNFCLKAIQDPMKREKYGGY